MPIRSPVARRTAVNARPNAGRSLTKGVERSLTSGVTAGGAGAAGFMTTRRRALTTRPASSMNGIAPAAEPLDAGGGGLARTRPALST